MLQYQTLIQIHKKGNIIRPAHPIWTATSFLISKEVGSNGLQNLNIHPEANISLAVIIINNLEASIVATADLVNVTQAAETKIVDQI